MDGNVWQALLFSTIAGLSTALGGVIALFAKRTDKTFLSVCLVFSAGVMIYVSFVELLSASQQMLSAWLGQKNGALFSTAALFLGMGLVALLNVVLPEDRANLLSANIKDEKQSKKLLKSGMITALTIALHNFPEGLATFVTALANPQLAATVVFAIAMHNIPEGIAVAAPVYFATGSKLKAFLYAFLSGMAEPLGAVIGYVVLAPVLSETVLGALYGVVSGVMLYISLAELIPHANEQSTKKCVIDIGLVGGMLTMAMSMVFLK